MTTKQGSLVLKALIIFYAIIYFASFVLPILKAGFRPEKASMPTVEVYTVPIAFILFLVGVAYSHINEKAGGIIILIWHFIVWFLSMFIWREAGIVLVLIFPMLFPPIFLIRNWYMYHNVKYLESINKWKLVLRILLINYAAIYLIIVSSEIVQRIIHIPLRGDISNSSIWNYSVIETGILVIELVLFVFACIVSFWKPRLAGLLLIIWYIIIAIACQQYFEIGNSGPWIFFSIPIVVQGILYFVLHFKELEHKAVIL